MIEMRKSPIHGWGVFAMNDIKFGDTVEVCPFIFVEGEELGEANDYVFTYSPKRSVLVLGSGSLFNHAFDANVDFDGFDKKTKTVTFYATKDIKAGDECFINYGKEYWKSRDIKLNN